MSSKQTAKVSTAIATETPSTVLVLGKLPRDVTLVGPVPTVLAQSVVLARNGYTFNTDAPHMIMGTTGTAFLYMTLGTPEQHAIAQAAKTTEEALALEVQHFEQRVEATAKQMLADQAAAAAKAEKDAQIAAAEQALAEMKAAAEKELAALKGGAA